ncbi:MAG: histidine phosphatase family protein [Gammaproteobacteria bacterium]|nr:histidine phosphatase family protein [Gammaproteobacteria bacterium]
MANLYIIRHAKTAPTHPDGDHCRELLPEGKLAFTSLIRKLQAQHWQLDHLIVSDATRTIQTANILKQILPNTPSARITPEIYEAPTSSLFEALQKLPSTANNVALIGHNPGVSRLIELLTQQNNIALSPGTVAILEVKVHWNELAFGSATLTQLHSP